MANHLKSENGPAQGNSETDANGAFKKGHRKRGGRKRGTPNLMTPEFKAALMESADKIGSDGQGKEGLVGYLKALAVEDPAAFARLLGRCL